MSSEASTEEGFVDSNTTDSERGTGSRGEQESESDERAQTSTDPEAASVPEQAHRAPPPPSRPVNGQVHPRRRRRSAPLKRTCEHCSKQLDSNDYQNHVKAHCIAETGVVVPVNRRCRACAKKSRPCKVAASPREHNTRHCEACLRVKEACSFKSTYRTPAMEMTTHPALL
ncbi:hypothetical protein XA68_16815 [Ophiocordyceps unilateralis]|uniref:Uncharacterized protein n=1 Tax=Ophiocordyceps unilateralis TaxID=268505 RepID=A0A2A9PL84_OPHUN|nr:hypothetical protein XA68_16815 [Ophiocordyceps unilateralis]